MSAVKMIYAGIRALGIAEEDDRRALYERVTGKRRLRDMSPREKDAIATELRRLGFRHQPRQRLLSGPYAKKLQALWISGWNLGLILNRQDAALVAFVRRQTGIDHPRFLVDPASADKAVEALKSWLTREGDVAWHPQLKLNPWLADHGAKIALAQWHRLPRIETAPRPSFAEAVTAETGLALNAMNARDWRNLCNTWGVRIRAVRP
ncbi:MAG: regulatory protein GemA [Natronohydrobacter sp.]|nr:regulatory protein GemA [Natronohydrobacter sp.]